jgi:hypothetical protein
MAAAALTGDGAMAGDDEKTDYELHEILVEAIRHGDVTVEVDFPRINRNNVPGFRTTDFIVPPLGIVVISGYVTLQFGPPWGIAMFAAGVAAFVLIVRPRAKAATIERVRKLALTNLSAWNAVWKNGGYRLTLASNPDIRIVGPRDEWQAFTQRHILAARG